MLGICTFSSELQPQCYFSSLNGLIYPCFCWLEFLERTRQMVKAWISEWWTITNFPPIWPTLLLSSHRAALNERSPLLPKWKCTTKWICWLSLPSTSAWVPLCTEPKQREAAFCTRLLLPSGWWRPQSWEVNGWIGALWRWGSVMVLSSQSQWLEQ